MLRGRAWCAIVSLAGLLAWSGCGLFESILVADSSAGDAVDGTSDVTPMDVVDVHRTDVRDAVADAAMDVPVDTCRPPANDDPAHATMIFAAELPPGGGPTCPTDGGTDAGTDARTDASLDGDAAGDVVLDGDASDVSHDSSEAGDVGDVADAGPPLPISTYTITAASNLCATHTTDLPCDSSHGGADVFYSFTLALPEVVYADTFPTGGGAPSFRTMLFFADTSGHVLSPTEGHACDANEACSAVSGSQIVAVLTPGTYLLGLSGVGSDQGSVDVHLKFLPVDQGGVTLLMPGMQTIPGTVTATSGGYFPVCGSTAHGAGDTYWWVTCPDAHAGILTAQACGLLRFAVVALRSADVGEICPALGSCPLGYAGTSIDTMISSGAGLNALYVGAPACTDNLSYTLTVNRP